MTNVQMQGLLTLLNRSPTQAQLYATCKELRKSCSSAEILDVIEFWVDEQNAEWADKLTDGVVSALVGHCHSSCSLV